MKRKIIASMMFILLSMSVVLVGCDDKTEKESADETTEEIIEEKDYLSVQTSISYSAGDDSDWSYGNQRKEFPNDETCYVRIGSTVITNSTLGKGDGDTITVTYRFTGVEKCNIEISDGKVSAVNTDDSNVMEFTRTISAAKEKSAEEDIVIFRYMPDGAGSVALEVEYDEQVAEKYDDLNTIYFED